MEGIARDWRTARLTARERAICEYAVKLTRTPWAMTRDDLDPLREAGLDDRALLDLAHVVGFFAHINRVADALGCDLEPGMGTS